MYQLKGGLVKAKTLGASYEVKDVANVKVKELLNNYAEAYLTLSHYAIPNDVTLLLRNAESLILGLLTDPTVTEWLVSLGNTALPTTNGAPVLTEKFVKSRDVWQAGFSATLCVPIGSPLNDMPDSEKTDIWLTRADTDYMDVQAHCLATVNGLIHRFDADSNGCYIKDGGITFMKSKCAHMGLISFGDIGKIKTYSIDPESIYHLSDSGKLSNSCYIKLPFNATNKVVGLVIGGYLHLLTRDLRVLGENSIKVYMGRLPLLERYMEAKYKIDMSSMERFFVVDEENKLLYDNEGFYSDECMKELLTLSQSFLIEIDTDNLSVDYLKTTNTFLPGRFYWHEKPQWPLRTQLGLLPSYISYDENGTWVIAIDNNLHQHRVFNDIDHKGGDFPIVTEARLSAQVQTYHRGDLIRYSKEVLEIKIPDPDPNQVLVRMMANRG